MYLQSFLLLYFPGKVVSGYRVRDGHWDEIGRQSPQKPQVHTHYN